MALTHAYCTLPELKTDLGNIADTDSDVALERAINAASRQIDGYCRQRFWLDSSVVAREFYATGDGTTLNLWQDDVAGIGSSSGVIVKSDTAGDGTYATTLTVGTDFLLLPRNAALASPARPYTQIQAGLSGAATWSFPTWSTSRPTVQVTAKWGWPVVPDEVVQACVLQAAQLFKARDAVFGVAAFGEFGPLRVRSALNPIAEGLLEPYAYVAVA